MKLSHSLILVFLTSLLAGCDRLGFEDPAVEQAREEAEGKAIGSACRQSARALEDCYQINRRASKAAIFAGWRDMDGYMRENKIEEIKPDFPMKPRAATGRPLESAEPVEQAAQKGAAATAAPAAAIPAEVAPARKAPPTR